VGIAKAPYFKVKKQPIRLQINSSFGRAGCGGEGAFSLCATERKLKKLCAEHAIAQHVVHEGLVKSKLLDCICKKSTRVKLYNHFKNLKIVPLQSSLNLAKIMKSCFIK
jgi:hypothetical protein